jgi:hypothetical protein
MLHLGALFLQASSNKSLANDGTDEASMIKPNEQSESNNSHEESPTSDTNNEAPYNIPQLVDDSMFTTDFGRCFEREAEGDEEE